MVPGSRSFLCFHRPLAKPQLQSVKTIPLPLGTSLPPAVNIVTEEFTMLVNGPSLDAVDGCRAGTGYKLRKSEAFPGTLELEPRKRSLCTGLEPYAIVATFCPMA